MSTKTAAPGGTTQAPAPGSTLLAEAKRLSFWAENAAPVGLVVLIIVFSILSPDFLTSGNIKAMLLASSILIVLSIAQAFIITTGGIDLSIAAAVAVGAVGFGLGWEAGWGFLGAVLLALVFTGLIGLINGLLITYGKVTDFIATLGTLGLATGLALILSDGKPISVNSTELLKLTTGSIGIFGYPVIIAAVVGVLAWIVMFRTRFGLHVQAVGGNEESASATGINARRVRIAVYLLASILAALACLMLVARVGAAEPTVNTNYLLNSIAAVVLGGVSLTGGKGKIVGPVLGALLLTALTNGLTLLGVSQFYQPLAVGLVVVLAALLTRFQTK